MIEAIELFAGVGGFRLGLERSTIEVVWANEWDKYAAQTYNKNFGGLIDTRDITTIPTSDIPTHDLLVGGFPCQAFSVAGKRAGFNETRGTLFFEIARILADKKPQHLLLENVKGLLSHDSGLTFQIILGVLADLGYSVEWQVLNSKDFGVPQNRERVFIIGHFGNKCSRQVFPLGISNQKNIEQLNGQVHQDYRVYDPAGLSPTLASNRGGGSATHPQIAIRQPLRFLDRNQKNIEGNYAFTVDASNTGGLLVENRIRRLTPLETERLQGFPDNYTEGVSETQRYKQMGNAVTVNVIEAIGVSLVAHFDT